MLLVSALIGVVVFGYFAMPSRGSVTRERIVWIRIAGLGMIAFALGYGLAFLTGRIGFSSTGILNRAAIGAAIGLAALSSRCYRYRFFLGEQSINKAAPVCRRNRALLLGKHIVVSVLGMYWVAAWPIQERVLEEIQAGIPELPSGSTVLLHGICPVRGARNRVRVTLGLGGGTPGSISRPYIGSRCLPVT